METAALVNQKVELALMYATHRAELGAYDWELEDERISELFFCILHQCVQQRPEDTRQCVDVLDAFGLLAMDRLADLSADDFNNDDALLAKTIFRRCGFDDQAIDTSVHVLSHISTRFMEYFDGKPQLLLRRHGQELCNAAVEMFESPYLSQERTRYAITYWLQNTMNLPISLVSPAIQQYCDEHRLTLDELVMAADEISLNVAVLDDLIEVAHKLNDAIQPDESTVEPAAQHEGEGRE